MKITIEFETGEVNSWMLKRIAEVLDNQGTLVEPELQKPADPVKEKKPHVLILTPEKTCACGVKYHPTGNAQRMCPTCKAAKSPTLSKEIDEAIKTSDVVDPVSSCVGERDDLYIPEIDRTFKISKLLTPDSIEIFKKEKIREFKNTRS